VRFSPDVRDGKPPLKFAWRFGDGSPESSEESPEHRFPRPGYYEVTLQVVDALGRGDEDTVGVSVPD
jgi:PKD repeat protein